MRVLRWIVCCVFEGFLEVVVRHADHGDTFHGDTLITGYPGTRPANPVGFGSHPDAEAGSEPTRVNPPGTLVVNERVAPLQQHRTVSG